MIPLKGRLVTLLLVVAALALATDAGAKCRDASHVIGGAMKSDVCWNCAYPIALTGQAEMGDGYTPTDKATGSDDFVCFCPDSQGVPQVGLRAHWWEPSHLVELTREPGCSEVLGGETLPVYEGAANSGGKGSSALPEGGDLRLGKHHAAQTKNAKNLYLHAHVYTYPLYQMLSLVAAPECNPMGATSIEVFNLSELLPVWNDDSMAAIAHPETVLFANPVATASCAAECGMLNAGQGPVTSQYWCAGCWGSLYPMTGHASATGSPLRATSLLATRMIATMHRMSMLAKTYGDNAMCTGGTIPYPTIPKGQYKMQHLNPMPEADDGGGANKDGMACCHNIGQSSLGWGAKRNVPGQANRIYLLWRFNECCVEIN